MRRDEVIARLKEVEPEIRARGAQALYLFGSHARDETTADSDVDVFIDKDQSRPFGFDRFIDIYFLLCDRLDGKVDYGTRDGLSPAIRAEIEREAIRVSDEGPPGTSATDRNSRGDLRHSKPHQGR